MLRKYNFGIRAVIGFAGGIFTALCVTLAISASFGDEYIGTLPGVAAWPISELVAVALSYLFCALLGVIFAVATAVFQIERWSFIGKCLVHFAITAGFYLLFTLVCCPVSELLGWLSPLVSLIATYGITWGIQYGQSRRLADAVNRRIAEEKEKNEDELRV